MTFLNDPNVYLEIHPWPTEKPLRCTLRLIGGGGEAQGFFGTAAEAYLWAEQTWREWGAFKELAALGAAQ
jgi:hypothetical protein